MPRRRPAGGGDADPALQLYTDVVAQATTPEAFAAALRATLSDTPGAAERRRASVAAESWEARAAEASRLIATLG